MFYDARQSFQGNNISVMEEFVNWEMVHAFNVILSIQIELFDN